MAAVAGKGAVVAVAHVTIKGIRFQYLRKPPGTDSGRGAVKLFWLLLAGVILFDTLK